MSTESPSIEPFPQLAPWVGERFISSRDAFLSKAQDTVKRFLEQAQALPDVFEWKFQTAETFRETVRVSKSPAHANRIYWGDFLETVEAYSYTTHFRVAELVKPTIKAINSLEYIPAAVLARSLLELGATYLSNANIILSAIEKLHFERNTLVISEDLEKFIVRAMWGTRLNSPENYLSQRNVLTTIQKITKSSGAQDLLPHYEYLCEVAHPNVIGNARYWSQHVVPEVDGPELRTISRRLDTPVAEEILEKVVWATSCGCNISSNSYEMISKGISILRDKIHDA